jgi:hypothetical protein
MKISNSKKQLAKIIHENVARRWFDGNNGIVGGAEGCIHGVNAISNWHQTRLSRDEYFHLYPAPVEVVVENKTRITIMRISWQFCGVS